MTNPINCQNQYCKPYPNQYSGVTINVTNPMMNAYPNGVTAPQTQHCNCHYCQPANVNQYPQHQHVVPQNINNHYVQQPQMQDVHYLQATRRYQPDMDRSQDVQYLLAQNPQVQYPQVENLQTNPVVQQVQPLQPVQQVPQYPLAQQAQSAQQAYPAQYYLNNYNILPGGVNNNGENSGAISTATNSYPQSVNDSYASMQGVKMPSNNYSEQQVVQQKNYNRPDVGTVNPAVISSYSIEKEEEPVDMSVSQNIIDQLDARAIAEKEKEANKEKVEVVALTNEYIKSLENYLNNPNKDIRLMAAKEVLTRLNEDRDRYDDAALNALLNKMMQDPDKLVRVAAMSAFSSGLASGNDFTVKLLNDMQKNEKTSEDDALEAANILLKMSETKETKYVNVQPAEVQE